MKIRYPWKQLEKGQGFFVPCLDTEKTIEEGIKAAVAAKVMAKFMVGIKERRLGVLFLRTHQ
jgi:hypothetical protein